MFTKEAKEKILEQAEQLNVKKPRESAIILQQIKDKQNENQEIINETTKKYNNSAPYCFIDRLLDELYNGKLKETLDETGCSMLPDDLLQRQIDKMLSDVSSLDGDF